MTDKPDPFERRLADRLSVFSDTPLATSRAPDDVVSAVMLRKTRGRVAPALAAGVIVLAAAGTAFALSQAPGGVASQSVRPSSSASESESSDLAYTCGGPPFGMSVFDDPEYALGTSQAGVALQEFIDSEKNRALPSTGWRLVTLGDDRASFVATVEGTFASADLENVDGKWRVMGSGQCRPMLALRDTNPGEWRIAPDENLHAGTTRFIAEVVELSCTGGASSEGRVRSPVIVYAPEYIVIAFSVEPLAGAELGSCIANPPTRIQVELDEPLGERDLLDGGSLPWQNARPAN
jgi:hypothetical protein